jgi:hypothetical protein
MANFRDNVSIYNHMHNKMDMINALRGRQVQRRADVGLPGYLIHLGDDIIDKIWKLVELPERAVTAARSGAMKLRIAFWYKTRRNRLHPEEGVQDIDEDDWAYRNSEWWMNLRNPRPPRARKRSRQKR